jgi:hypothetical protein
MMRRPGANDPVHGQGNLALDTQESSQPAPSSREQIDSIVALQMRAIRQIVADTDRRAERHPQGA